MLRNLILHSTILIPWIPLPQPPHILLRLGPIDLETHNPFPEAQLHCRQHLRAARREIIMPFSRRRVLGSRGGAAVLPLQAVGIVAGGRVGAEFGVFGVAECDYELIVFFEGAS